VGSEKDLNLQDNFLYFQDGKNSPLKAEEQGVGKNIFFFPPCRMPHGWLSKKNPENRASEKTFASKKEESHFVIFSSVMKVRVGKGKKKKEEKKKGMIKKKVI
jgi:hypothetical protein